VKKETLVTTVYVAVAVATTVQASLEIYRTFRVMKTEKNLKKIENKKK
jgi:hypothetical protein